MKQWRLIAILLVAFYAHSTWATGTFNEVKSGFAPSDTLILDRNGELLQRIRTDATVRRGQWVALADVSPALRTALVLSEDKRFYEHGGVDWRAASAAAWGNLWNSKTRGASTLTMQLAGLLDDDLQRGRDGKGGRSVTQKIGQTVSAQMLERSWRKDQILEAYLNLVPLRGELVGIDAISRTLFGKAAHGLDEREAAITAALVRAPNARASVVARRACEVLGQMQRGAAKPPAVKGEVKREVKREIKGKPAEATQPDCETLDLITTAALQRKSFEASAGIAPHLARRVLALRAPSPQPSLGGRGSHAAEAIRLPSFAGRGSNAAELTPLPARAGRRIHAAELLPLPLSGEGRGEGGGEPMRQGNVLHTTLRAPLQRFAVQTLQQHLRELRGRNVEDGAVLVLDNASGEVLAWVGSSGDLSAAAEVDGVTALRQPGSTLKPFLYAQAIAGQRITAASLLEDAATHIPTAGGLYIPQNYDRQFKGWVSARTALGASLNVPAVRLLAMVSPDAFHKQLKGVGLPLKESGDFYGYSLALGSAEVSLLSLANSYRTLSNGGEYSPTTFMLPSRANGGSPTRTDKAGKRAGTVPAIDPRAAFIVTDILADPMARARTFGTDSVLATRFWTAVKTGTSKDMRDNWAIGFSQRYTVGVWVGNASGAPMWDVSGTTGAAPIWATVMNHLHKTEPSRAPPPPAGLVQTQVTFGAASDDSRSLEAPRSEWFLHGTEQNQFTINTVATYALSTKARGQNDSQLGAETRSRITAPAPSTIIALDPDIPPNRQRVSFTAEGSNLRWLMDGKPFARGASAQWLPWPGKHVVQIADAHGAVQDEVRLEVRGAGVKASQASFARGR